ncbi:hypothetical protein L218DRAFT_990472 [Marasmius fiardii PR-910]|nr:hypothetical protein L218DRAFT_990472 [Marasmius fiardii PR-910]
MSSILEEHYGYPSPPSSNHPSPQITENIRQLDLAYQRVRQLRRDILQTYVSRSRDNSMGPPHEALLLSGGQGQGGNEHQNADLPPSQRLRSPVPPEVMERLRQFETHQVESESGRHSLRLNTTYPNLDEPSTQTSTLESPRPSQPPLLRLRPSSLHLPPSPISPISPPRQPLLPPRTLEPPSHTPRWTSISDDPHTLLGRRVAAVMRTVENRTSTTTQTPNPNPEPTRRTIPGLFHQDLDHSVLSISRHHRSEPSSAAFREGPRTETDARSPAPLRTVPRRARTIRGDNTRQNSSSRLSTLSNFSGIHGLPTPTSTLPHSLILFEEPQSYESRPETGHGQSEERMESIDEENPERRYHRNEIVHGLGLSIDWDSASRRGSYPEATFDPDYHQRRVIRYPEDVVPPSNVIRLNADGDEISVEEPNHWPRWIQNPVDRGSLPTAEDLQSNHHRPSRIVILPDGREETWPSVTMEAFYPERIVIGKTTPFSPDPLPMPLPDEATPSPGLLVTRETCLIAH